MRFMVDLAGVTLSERAGLVRIPLAMIGRGVWRGIKFAITRDTMKSLFSNFGKRRADVVIDYEHASEYPQLAAGGPIPAAGWLKEIEPEPDEKGVLWGLAEFTKRALELIASREIKYISPSINWGARDKSSGEPQGATLQSVALTNRPFLEAMPAIQLSEAGWKLFNSEVPMSGTSLKFAEAQREIDDSVKTLMNENPVLTYGAALKHLYLNNPELFARREALYRIQCSERDEAMKFAASESAQASSELAARAKEKMRQQPGLTLKAAISAVAREDEELAKRAY